MTNQTSPKNRAGRSSGTTGAKMLITAASIAAVIGGWAGFTIEQARSAAKESTEGASSTDQVSLELAPLPTLVPEPTSVIGSISSQPAAFVPSFGTTPLATPAVLATPVGIKPPVSDPKAIKSQDKAPKKEPKAKTRTS